MTDADSTPAGGAGPSDDPGPSGTSLRPFRFGVVAAAAESGEAWVAKVRRIETLGFSTLLVPDNLERSVAPIAALAMAAAVTTTLRLGTYVLANDFRNPVLLAKEIGTLDMLSGGRVELGLGVGRPGSEAENRALGLTFDAGPVRVARLEESISILRRLLAGQSVADGGAHYPVADAGVSPLPVQRPRVPILVGGSGPRMLRLAGREADIVALGIAPDATFDDAAGRIALVREGAGDRFGEVELHVNLMAVGDRVQRYVSMALGLTAEGLARIGAVAAVTGSTGQMVEQLLERRERLGISYLAVSEELMDTLAPVVERLAGR